MQGVWVLTSRIALKVSSEYRTCLSADLDDRVPGTPNAVDDCRQGRNRLRTIATPVVHDDDRTRVQRAENTLDDCRSSWSQVVRGIHIPHQLPKTPRGELGNDRAVCVAVRRPQAARLPVVDRAEEVIGAIHLPDPTRRTEFGEVDVIPRVVHKGKSVGGFLSDQVRICGSL